MRTKVWLLLSCMILGLFSIQSCKKDEDKKNNDIIIGDVNYPKPSVNIAALLGHPDGKIEIDAIVQAEVTMNDKNGNQVFQIQLQDETAGITLRIHEEKLYEKYPVGTVVSVDLKGLEIYNFHGNWAIGILENDNGFKRVLGISGEEADNRIIKTNLPSFVKPLSLGIDEITLLHSGSLIKLPEIQFLLNHVGQTYGDKDDACNRTIEDINNKHIILRTYPQADFIDDIIPENSGEIIGICHFFATNPQIVVRDIAEIKLDQERFNDFPFGVNSNIAEIKSLHQEGGQMTQITEDLTIEAIVTANDENENLYKRIYIQDETGGIQLNINDYDLFKTFPVGTKLQVKLRNLYIDQFGEYKIGVPYGDNGAQKLGGIPANAIGSTIQKLDDTGEATPAEINITGVTDNLVGSVVKVNNVQFIDSDLGQPYAGSENTNRTLTDADGNELIVRTSSYASFKSEILPEGSGNITAILTKFGTNYQLMIRDVGEVKMTDPRFDNNNNGGNGGEGYPSDGNAIYGELTIADLKASYNGSGIQSIEQNKTIKATVVADDEDGNLYKNIYIEDATGGIQLKINDYDLYQNFPVGTNIELNVQGLSLDHFGEYKIGVPYIDSGHEKLGGIPKDQINNHISIIGNENYLPSSILDLNNINDELVGALVRVKNVQFIDDHLDMNYADDGNSGNRSITNASGNTIYVRTSSFASFANEKVAQGSGSIIAILTKFNTTYHLMIRNIKEVNMDDPRF